MAPKLKRDEIRGPIHLLLVLAALIALLVFLQAR
ncbi:MAG: hypothetical protein RLZZ432_892 [Chloroflexota bacterium]|jgi:hypothetical protein